MDDNNTPNAVPNMTAPIDPSEVSLAEQAFAELDGNGEQKPAQSEAETKPEDTGAEPEKTDTEGEVKPSTELSLDAPNRYEGESDTQYQIRTEIWRMGRAKASAETEEEKSLITQHIKELRKGLGSETVKQKQANSSVETTDSTSGVETDEEQAARIALEQLGYIDKKGVEELLNKALNEQKIHSAEQEHSAAISEFYKARPDILADPTRKQALENYVISNFNITPSTTKRQLSAHLEMTANFLFPKSARTMNSASAAEKRTVVNASGNTRSAQSAESMADDLRKAGFSEEDIKASGW